MNRIYHSLKDFQRIWIRYLSITTAKVSSINTTAKECGRYVDCLYDSFHTTSQNIQEEEKATDRPITVVDYYEKVLS